MNLKEMLLVGCLTMVPPAVSELSGFSQHVVDTEQSYSPAYVSGVFNSDFGDGVGRAATATMLAMVGFSIGTGVVYANRRFVPEN